LRGLAAALLAAIGLSGCAVPTDDLRASTISAYSSQGAVVQPRSRSVTLRPGGELVVAEAVGGVAAPDRSIRLEPARYDALIAELEAAGANRPFPSRRPGPPLVGGGSFAFTVRGARGVRTEYGGALTEEGSRAMRRATQALDAAAAAEN
jgi:hypothetical protein